VCQIPDAVDTVVCAPDDVWKYHPKHVEQFPDVNKLCNVASCWIYEYTGILLGAHPILHISRIRVNSRLVCVSCCGKLPAADGGLALTGYGNQSALRTYMFCIITVSLSFMPGIC